MEANGAVAAVRTGSEAGDGDAAVLAAGDAAGNAAGDAEGEAASMAEEASG